jgi:N-acyl-phosphatidylethanolamine-hydrolysing phospholipase D
MHESDVSLQRHERYNTRHHPKTTIGTYRNPQGRRRIRYDELFEFLFQKVTPRPNPGVPFTRIAPDDLKKEVDAAYRIHWLGQSSVLVQSPDVTFLTDPVFADRVSPIFFVGPKRLVGLPILSMDLPRLDYIVLSHNHYDHMDKQAIRFLHHSHDPTFIVPLGLKRVLANWGIEKCHEMDWWEFLQMPGIDFHCVPARHFSGRTLADNNRTLWSGWVMELTASGHQFFFAGDTAYGRHFQEIGEVFPNMHMTFMPIGAYRPRRMMQAIHVNPEEALRAFLDCHAELMLGIHWGTYDLATEPILEPMERTLQLAAEYNLTERIHVLPIGGRLDPPRSGK